MKEEQANIDFLPFLVVADEDERIFEVPELRMAASSIRSVHLPEDRELIRLPFGSDLYALPGRTPIAYDPKADSLVRLPGYGGKRVTAVAAFLAPAHTWLYRAAYERMLEAPTLPLYAYAAAGWREGTFWATGVRVDADVRQDLAQFNLREVVKRAQEMLRRYPKNRLVEHLVQNCVVRYGCPAARNFVLQRWECPVPTSPGCNAACVGCLSLQPAPAVPASQERIAFVPTVDEIVQFTVPHLEAAPNAIISFGQGCEGEPLEVADVVEASIREIRRRTQRGTININTNASDPDAVERLCQAGLDAVRVSLNSAQARYYERYFCPRNYSFNDVVESIYVAKRCGSWVSINYFIFPGFTDHPEEMDALFELVKRMHVDMIQTRNLNIDPELYIETLGLDNLDESDSIGFLNWMDRARECGPWLRFGYFNPPVEARSFSSE